LHVPPGAPKDCLPCADAICQLARKLEDNGSPVDYARRRRPRRLSPAQLDVTAWPRQHHVLTHRLPPGPTAASTYPSLPAAPVHLARLRRLLEALQLPGPRSRVYIEFVFIMPEQMASACTSKPAHCSPRPASLSPSPGGLFSL
jgi:hypothetical protein